MDRTSYLQTNGLIRLAAAIVGVSLIAATGVLLVEARSLPKPLMQLPAAFITLGLGALALYASSLAVMGRRAIALLSWGTCIALLVALPMLQVLPIEYDTPTLLDIQELAPPLWQYTVAIPILLFLFLETAIPGYRPNATSNLFLLVGLTSAVAFLFFTTALIGDVVNYSILIFIPDRLFYTVMAPTGISCIIVIGVVLARKGLVALSIAVLLATGLGLEWMSTWSYTGPHFLDGVERIPFARYPLLPVLAGTLPGALAASAAVIAGWEVYGLAQRGARGGRARDRARRPRGAGAGMKRVHAVTILMVVTLLMALGSGVPVYYRVFYLTALVLAFALVWAQLSVWRLGVSVDRTFGKLRVGERLESSIQVRSASPVPKFGLEVRELSEMPGHNTAAVINLPPFGEASVSLSVPLVKRGVYRIGPPTLAGGDPFGIFTLRRRRPGTEPLAVMPYVVDIPPFSVAQGDTSGDGSLLKSTPEATASASTVREYRSEDSARYIHWPATARKGRLMLKQFDGGMEDVLWIVLDLQAGTRLGDELENTEEYAITAAASIAKSYSEVGWAVGLLAHGDKQYLLPPQEGGPAYERISMALTEARSEGAYPISETLSYWQTHVPSSAVSLVVISASPEPGWGVALESVVRQGVTASAVVVDPTSFGGREDPALLLSRLQRRGVPTYMLRKGEDIAQGLQQRWRMGSQQRVEEPVGVTA